MSRAREVRCRPPLTLFHSTVSDPVEVERTEAFVLRNLPAPTTNTGVEALAMRMARFFVRRHYAYVRSREITDGGRIDVR